MATGSLTVKPTAVILLDVAEEAPRTTAGHSLFASVIGTMFAPAGSHGAQLQRTLRALLFEIGQSFNYFGGFIVAYGLLFCGRALTRRLEFWLLGLLFLGDTCVLILLGMKVSYISERHVLPLILLGCYPCVLAVLDWCRWLARWRQWDGTIAPEELNPLPVRRACLALIGLGIVICAPKTLAPLHGNRAGNHQAGLWLAKHIETGDVVEDEHFWSHFYAGLVFLEGKEKEQAVPIGHEPKCYTVISRSSDHGVRERRDDQEKRLHAANGSIVYSWPEGKEPEKARVVVYAAPRDAVTRPWHVQDGVRIVPVSRPR
jgi:hypothetical protein